MSTPTSLLVLRGHHDRPGTFASPDGSFHLNRILFLSSHVGGVSVNQHLAPWLSRSVRSANFKFRPYSSPSPARGPQILSTMVNSFISAYILLLICDFAATTVAGRVFGERPPVSTATGLRRPSLLPHVKLDDRVRLPDAKRDLLGHAEEERRLGR